MTSRSLFFVSVSTLSVAAFLGLSVFAIAIDSYKIQPNSPSQLISAEKTLNPIQASSQLGFTQNAPFAAGGFAVGDRVTVVYPSSANTRVDGCGAIVQTVAPNQQGSIVAGPTSCGGLVRWQVQWDSGFTAWIAENDGSADIIDKVAFRFVQNDRVYSTAAGNGVDTGLSVRTAACGTTTSRRVPLNAKGKILSATPTAVPNCSAGAEFLYWWNTEWYDQNGTSIGAGWTVDNYLQKDTSPIVDKIAPTASISNAVAGKLYTLNSLAQAVEVQATDAETFVVNVELYLNSGYIANDEIASDGWKFSIEPLAPGTYTLQVRALDAGGNAALSQPITLHVIDKTNPDYQAIATKNQDGLVTTANIGYFTNIGVIRYAGTIEVQNSCTYFDSGKIVSTNTGFQLEIITKMNMLADSICAMGSKTIPFEGYSTTTLSSQQLLQFNSLFTLK